MLCGLVAGSLAMVVPALAADKPTVEDFVAAPDIRDVRLSPSGKRLMILRLAAGDRYAVELRETAELAKGGVSFDSAPAEIRDVRWLTDDLIVGTLRERRARGPRYQWFGFTAIFDGTGRFKTKLPSENAQLLGTDYADPSVLYVAYDSTGDGSADVHRFDPRTGKSTRLLRGSERRFGFEVDRAGEVRLSSTFDPASFELTYWGRQRNGESWREISRFSPVKRDIFQPLGFLGENPNELTVIANAGKDKAGVHVFDLASGRFVRALYQRDDVDVEDAVLGRDGTLLGLNYTTDRRRTHWLDPKLAALEARLAETLPGRSFSFQNAAENGSRVVRAFGPLDPSSFYLVRADGRVTGLGSARPQFTGKSLADVQLTSIKARDGLNIPVYLTAQPGSGARPLVVLPHGGPWQRDRGGFDDWPQLLAAQGYLVAQPQFRGSTGFGKAHWLAGDRQWGAAMQTDLDDVARALAKDGRADPKRTAMFGWSYGGYAAYTAAVRGGDIYRCAIAGAGVSDLDRISATLADSPFTALVQRPTIVGPSPVRELNNATIPVFVLHGDDDGIVPVSHARDAVRVLSASGKKNEYRELKGVDHGGDRMTAEHRRAIYDPLVRWLKGPCGLS